MRDRFKKLTGPEKFTVQSLLPPCNDTSVESLGVRIIYSPLAWTVQILRYILFSQYIANQIIIIIKQGQL